MTGSLWMPIGLAAAALVLGAGPVQAWTVECKDSRCTAMVDVKEAGKTQRFMTFAVLFNTDATNPAVVITTPLGTALDAGARLVSGGTELKLVYKVCYPDGCQAYASLKESELALLRSAKLVSARFFAITSEKPVAANIELSGLAEAIDGAVKK